MKQSISHIPVLESKVNHSEDMENIIGTYVKHESHVKWTVFSSFLQF
jgi:hypothetical protein